VATKSKAPLNGDAPKPAETAATAGKDATDRYLRAGVDAAQKSDELSVYSKGNVEAVVQAGSIYARGLEDLGKILMAISQSHLEASVAAAKAVLGCTSLRQMVDLQTGLARSNFDKLVADGNKLSEVSLKVANEALEPLQARVNAAVGKFIKPAAA